jgi:protein SCO1/2
MKRHAPTIWFVLMVFVLPFSAYGIYSLVKKGRALPVYGNVEPGTDHRVGDFSMTDQQGRVVTQEIWKDRIVVADFFFTHCSTICPKMTKSLKRVQDAFSNDEGIVITSFTVDPERDSSEQLDHYGKRYGVNDKHWELLTGDKKEIYRLARNGFRVVATDGDGGPGDFIHSEKLVLLDRQRRIRGYYDGTNEKEVNQLIRDIKKLRNEK